MVESWSAIVEELEIVFAKGVEMGGYQYGSGLKTSVK
jgi:hypothetical protein